MKSIHRLRCSTEGNHQKCKDVHRTEMASWPVAIADSYMERFKNRAPSLYQDFIGGRTEHSSFFNKSSTQDAGTQTLLYIANPAWFSIANSTGGWNKELSLILCGSCKLCCCYSWSRTRLNYKLDARNHLYKYASLVVTQNTPDHLPIFQKHVSPWYWERSPMFNM